MLLAALLFTALVQAQVLPPTGTTCHSAGRLPDPVCTPGARNPAVTHETLGQTACARGWSATVRPPTIVTNRIKRQVMQWYGYDGQDPRTFELDHLVPLELGGAQASTSNLWPEPWPEARQKDRVENWLHRQVCTGQVYIFTAQAGMAADWSQYESDARSTR